MIAPGIHALPAEAYHGDPCPAPSLSASIAKLLLEKTPRHAWMMHPRLNPDYQAETKASFDLGSAAHALVLGDEQRFAVVDADDWRTNAAKAARDDAYKAGKVPLLPHQFAAAKAMAAAARAQLDASSEAQDAFRNGRPEQTMIWREGDVWCRARLDWLPAGGNVFYDYKSTGASAHPDLWGQRTMFDIGADVQAGFYRRGIRALLGIKDPHFRFVVQENEPPYALSIIGLSPAARILADMKAEIAIETWRWCITHGRWPGYPGRVAYPDLPVWQERKWTERKDMAEQVRAVEGKDMLASMIEWQAPQ